MGGSDPARGAPHRDTAATTPRGGGGDQQHHSSATITTMDMHGKGRGRGGEEKKDDGGRDRQQGRGHNDDQAVGNPAQNAGTGTLSTWSAATCNTGSHSGHASIRVTSTHPPVSPPRRREGQQRQREQEEGSPMVLGSPQQQQQQRLQPQNEALLAPPLSAAAVSVLPQSLPQTTLAPVPPAVPSNSSTQLTVLPPPLSSSTPLGQQQQAQAQAQEALQLQLELQAAAATAAQQIQLNPAAGGLQLPPVSSTDPTTTALAAALVQQQQQQQQQVSAVAAAAMLNPALAAAQAQVAGVGQLPSMPGTPAAGGALHGGQLIPSAVVPSDPAAPTVHSAAVTPDPAATAAAAIAALAAQQRQQQQQLLAAAAVSTVPQPPSLPLQLQLPTHQFTYPIHLPTPPILTVQDRDQTIHPPVYNGVNPNHPNLRVLSRTPPIFAVDDFLSAEECRYLIDVASDSFTPAPVVGRGAGEVSPSRTSSTCYLAREDLPGYMSRICALTGKPVNHCELPQIGRYMPSERYLQHYDAFDLGTEDGRRFASNGGQRTVTVLVYLNDVARGGCTSFPLVPPPPSTTPAVDDAATTSSSSSGAATADECLRVRPRRGTAVVFFPATVDGYLDRSALHAAEPAVDTKYVSQVWIRQGDYGGQPSKRIGGVGGVDVMGSAGIGPGLGAAGVAPG